MSNILNYLLSGGTVRRGVADHLHGVIWASRLAGGRSDAPEMCLLDNFDLRNRVALDIGAHAGNWSLNLSRRVGPGGLVMAYEALPHYGKALSLALKLLRARNVRVRSMAVGDSEKTISLRWRGDDNELLTGRTHIDSSGKASAGVVQVQMVTIDHDLAANEVDPTRVAFVKIDVEGAELEVLRGAKSLLSTVHPAVFLEAEPQWLRRFDHSVGDVFAELSRHGYRPYLVSESGIAPTDPDAYLQQYESGSGLNNVLFLYAFNTRT